MSELNWWEFHLPRGMTLDTVTSLLRPIASRPKLGIMARTPRVVIEQWSIAGTTRHLLGLELPLGESFVAQLAASVPDLLVRRSRASLRPPVVRAADVSLTSLAASLRTDVAIEVSRAVGAALQRTPSSQALVLQWVIGPSQQRAHAPTEHRLVEQLGFVRPRDPSATERSTWRQKASEPLFGIRGKIGATAVNAALGDLRSAISLTDSAQGTLRIGPPSPKSADALNAVTTRRWGGIVSAKELAVLLALPLDGTEDERAVPVGNLPPRPSNEGRTLGISQHPATRGAPVVLPRAALSRHVAVIGPTGVGKSELAARMALDDIEAGRSLILIEPKGDLCDAVLGLLDDDARKRVIAIEAGETDYPIGTNVLSGQAGTIERQADEIVGLLRDLHGTALGPRSADVLLHALIIAGRMPGGTLVDVPVILTSSRFRQHAVKDVRDPLVIDPWLAWFDSLSDNERAQVVSPILNKLRAFTSRPSIRRLLGQATPGWDWDRVLNEQGIVLISLNRGAIGPESTRLLGALLLGQLWAAIQRRTRLREKDRPLASVIVDEWQLFTGGLDFADVLSTARGMNVSMTVLNQHLHQLSPALRAAVAGNAHSRVVFKPSVDDEAGLAALLGSNAVTAGDLKRLDRFEAVAAIYGQDGAFHLTTTKLPAPVNQAESVRRDSQRRYGQEGSAVDAALLAKWDPPQADSGIGRRKRGGV